MKNVLAFIGYRLQRRVLPLSILTFLLGVFLAMIPGYLGCVNWWWLRWTVLLEPVWLIGDLSEFNYDPYTWVMHLFCCLLWLAALGWVALLVGQFRPAVGDFYDTKKRQPGPMDDLPPEQSHTPWARLLVPPVLLLILIVLVATDLPLTLAFRLHRDALKQKVDEELASEEVNRPYESTQWVGIYPVQLVIVHKKEAHCALPFVEVEVSGRRGGQEGTAFTETSYDYFFSHHICAGFVYRGRVEKEEDQQKASDRRLDDDWQVYRRGGGRWVFKQLP